MTLRTGWPKGDAAPADEQKKVAGEDEFHQATTNETKGSVPQAGATRNVNGFTVSNRNEERTFNSPLSLFWWMTKTLRSDL